MEHILISEISLEQGSVIVLIPIDKYLNEIKIVFNEEVELSISVGSYEGSKFDSMDGLLLEV